jgi:NADPH:quinone reductase-like Zn-dependent oxidoreductase
VRTTTLMHAIVYGKSGVLKLEEIEKPHPADDEVLLKVRAASVNPLDYHFSNHPFLRPVMARVTKVKTLRPGRDVAGQVEAVGKNVKQFKIGDDVFGACNGAFAEYACGRESAFVTKPTSVSFVQAASVPVAALTALQGFRDKAHVQPGQRVLINGAAGGVGTFAVQIAKTFGAEVTGVCSTRNVELVRSIGADTVIDYTREDLTSNGKQYDLIFDLVANHSFAEYRRVLTPRGIYIGAGMIGLDGSMIRVLRRLISEFVERPFVSQKSVSLMAKLTQNDLDALGRLIVEGKVTPVIDRRYSLSEAPDAVNYLAQGHARGKVIIDLDHGSK